MEPYGFTRTKQANLLSSFVFPQCKQHVDWSKSWDEHRVLQLNGLGRLYPIYVPWIQVFICMLVIFVLSYTFIVLAWYLVDLKISYNMYNLTWTPTRVIKKKKVGMKCKLELPNIWKWKGKRVLCQWSILTLTTLGVYYYCLSIINKEMILGNKYHHTSLLWNSLLLNS
jgi:hypothetical protein